MTRTHAKIARLLELAADPELSAKNAGLRYVNDDVPGIRREATAEGFRYIDADGEPITLAEEIKRIDAIGIPPAWTDVWICRLSHGHIQATGRDARRRKQYRYHPRWHEARDETKYGRTLAFGAALPQIRERTLRDLRRQGLPREKVIAAVVRLLEMTLIRVGNEEYAKNNDSFGLTTMRDDHVDIEGATLTFRFRGKSGKDHTIDVRDRRVANIVRRCQDLPGQELFQYIDEGGEPQTVGSDHVNAYLRDISGDDFSAKDFRTWFGTVIATAQLRALAVEGDPTKKKVVQAIKATAARLGNTPSVCRKCYVHPAVIETYLRGALGPLPERASSVAVAREAHALTEEEEALLALLQQHLSRGEPSLERQLRDSAKLARTGRRRAAGKSVKRAPAA